MIFGHFLLETNEANAYVIGCPERHEALLVDVGNWDPRIPAFLAAHNLSLSGIFITHNHYDHSGGLAEALACFPVPVYAGGAAIGGLPTVHVHQHSHVPFGEHNAHVLAVPGHTSDGLCLLVPGMVFTGDALFAGSVGGTADEEEAALQREAIRENLFSLPGNYRVYPGHGPASTIEIERSFNPFFN